ncbi:DUF177 domain-containing protein [Trueperella pecoris]|uniref:DUF177 domain-containing protein n=1 Tax=Trueperella pecoris TaxID=2733571 RepID=A0A7M1QZP8_9ACTO|nr:YceD family protein [Trueperella pecoris]QOR46954.1 DUF177 domain-containing protein [Trueperella pecoris]
MSNPYIVSIVDLPRTEGAEREFRMELPAPAECGVALMGVPQGEPIEVDLRLQSVSEGVLVLGDARATAVGQCARCLRDLTVPMDEAVTELVFYPESRQALLDEGDEEAEDMPLVVDDRIDLEPIIRDALILSMPLSPLCRPDCPGLCSECGEPWDDLPADHKHEFLDPRFSALDALAAQLAGEEATDAGEGGRA